MNVSSMKNMVVLKNLPSNIIDEAIVILKANTKVKNLEKVENFNVSETNNGKREEKEYALKEAEMLVSDYISKIENNKKPVKKDNVKRLKMWAYISTAVAFLEFFL